jgi:hypothetical protein
MDGGFSEENIKEIRVVQRVFSELQRKREHHQKEKRSET